MPYQYQQVPTPSPWGRRAGTLLGIAPQVILLVVLLLFLHANSAQDRAYLAYMVFANVVVVPLAALVGVLCLLSPHSRMFGQALMISTGFAAAVFTLACLGLTAA